MDKEERLRFTICFDYAVSRLSIAGYFLEGFIDNCNCLKSKYDVYRRFDRSKPIAVIERGGILKLINNDGSDYYENKKEIMIALKLKKGKLRNLKKRNVPVTEIIED